MWMAVMPVKCRLTIARTSTATAMYRSRRCDRVAKIMATAESPTDNRTDEIR